MSRILVAIRSNPERWADLFRNELPDHEIVTAVPEDGRPTPVAVVGVPPPGLLARLVDLRLVLSINAGVEHLLASGEVPADVPIVRMVDPGLVDGMVEWVAARVLAWHRNLSAYAIAQAEGRWEPRPEKLARERTAAVLGAGALGGPVARMLAGFGFRTRAWSRSPRGIEGVTGFAGRDALAQAVDGADILVNLLPSTAETVDIIDAGLLALMAPGGLVVNGGRGAAIVEADLLAALDSGQLDAAALDVFRGEPLSPGHPFWTHPRVWVTPHVAAITHPHTSVAIMADSLRRFEAGEPVDHVVDRAQGY